MWVMLFGSCWVLLVFVLWAMLLGLETKRVDLDFKWSFCLGLAGFCWGLSCGSCCLGLETVRVDLDFEWSCCLGLETERVVLVGNEWENSSSSMKE